MAKLLFFHFRKKTNLVLSISLGMLMLVITGALLIRFQSLEAVAGFGLSPRWSTPPVIGDASYWDPVWGGPIQNTSSSTLYVFTDQNGDDYNNFVYRVNDDGSAILGTQLSDIRPGIDAGDNIAFLSDGLDGAYVVYTQHWTFVGKINQIARVNANGTRIWDTGLTGGIPDIGVANDGGGFHQVSVSNDGNIFLIYSANGRVCGMKVNRTTGSYMWGTNAECSVNGHTTRLLMSGHTPRGVANDGAGGAIVFGSDSGSNMRARRILPDGSSSWTSDLFTGSTLNGTKYDGGFVYFWWKIGNSVFLDKISVADGSRPWSSPVEFASTSSAQFILSGANELAMVKRALVNTELYMNRVDMETGTKKWSSDVLITSQAESLTGTPKVFAGEENVVFVSYCHDNQPSYASCVLQALDASGSLIFPDGGASIHESLPGDFAIGHHRRPVSGGELSCISHSYHVAGAQIEAQQYCLQSTPVLSDPICSIDNGDNFVLCSDAQQGTTVSHVQVSCEAGDFYPFSHGALAGTSGRHEDNVLTNGRYVVYRKENPGNDYSINRYDLGPDQLFHTSDDGGDSVLIDASPADAHPWQLDGDRLLYGENSGGPTSLRIVNITTGAIDPGTIANGASSQTASLSDRYITYTRSGGSLYKRDIGADLMLGTGDDGPDQLVQTYDSDTDPIASYSQVNSHYIATYEIDSDHGLRLYDLATNALTVLALPANSHAQVPRISGRYITWSDLRNDSGCAPYCNYDVYLYDMGPDERYGTGDDVGETAISTSTKYDSFARIFGDTIIWSRANYYEAADTWYRDWNVYSYQPGDDAEFGTADDVGPLQLTNFAHNENSAQLVNNHLFWVDDRNGLTDSDIYVRPVGSDGALEIDSVRFTMTSPSGDRYADEIAGEVNGETHTLYYPILIDEEGQWTLEAECEDSSGQLVQQSSIWDVGPWPFSDQQKLSVYDGVAQISRNSGDTMEIGNAGRDIASNGRIYVRPNGSYAGAYFEGVDAAGSQRLHLPYGVPGQHTLFAKGTGTVDSANGASGVAGIFAGLSNNAGGSGVFGEVMSCASSGGCAGGYFLGGSQIGVSATTANAALPALRAENTSTPDASSLNTSASFTGKVQVSQDISGSFSPDTCTWVDVNVGDTVCPNEGFVFGYDSTSFGVTDRLYCCGN